MTGEFLGAFDVELRDGMLVFSRTSGSDEGGCPLWGRTGCKSSHEREKIGPSECKKMGELWQKGRRQFIDLANLVTDDGEPRWSELLEHELLPGLILKTSRHRRYSVRSEEALLRLASEIGPLFGIYGGAARVVAGTSSRSLSTRGPQLRVSRSSQVDSTRS